MCIYSVQLDRYLVVIEVRCSENYSQFSFIYMYLMLKQRSEGTINEECPAFCERLENVVRNKAKL